MIADILRVVIGKFIGVILRKKNVTHHPYKGR